MSSRILKTSFVLMLLVFIGSFFAKRINLATADIGRHIKNGEYTLQHKKILSTNHYSYTEPDFPVVNHHWLAGVVFYLVWRLFGFRGLSLFYILLNVGAFAFFFRVAWKKTSLGLATVTSLLFLPLFVDRTEIRPEGFSYLLLGVFLYLLLAFKEDKIRFKLLLPLVFILQIFWVNLHIFFIFGIFLVIVFLTDAVIFTKNKIRAWVILTAFTVLASLFNPYGVKGLFEPFMILREYGYMIVENQPILFMQKRFPHFLYLHVELALVGMALSFVHLVSEKKFRELFCLFTLTLTFGFLAFEAIRGIPLFGLFLVPFSAIILQPYVPKKLQIQRFFLLGSLVFILLSFGLQGHYFAPVNAQSGVGLLPHMQGSAEFFRENKLQGPVFNNYDIGGYLIFNFADEVPVFVDNRPEAYSVEFFTKTYIPMQENGALWEEMVERYSFNVIYFYRRDMTPWAQPFLIDRIKDPTWVPIFVDDYVLILIRNVEENREVIDKFALPKETFVMGSFSR